ncbi:MAG: hypothetical protein IKQ91_01985 [Oscillospiraceae bacterium]|nr:hypothetical protein [Oscillospiraceae bacterium]
MAHDYSNITGEQIVSGVRKYNQRIRILCILGIIVCCFGLIAAFKFLIPSGHYVYTGFAVVLIVICFYALFDGISKAGKTIAAGENAAIFRKFGTPETLAARIAAESGEPLLDSKGSLICDSFIMKHGNFESYIPYDKALLIYRREHSTNGIKDSVSLVVHDAYGDSVQYPFKMGRRGQEQMQEIMMHISQKNEKCAVGYSPQNLNYAKQMATPLDKESE